MSEPFDRRSFLSCCSSLGLGGTLLPGVLWAQVRESGAITVEHVERAEEIAGLSLTEEEREMLLHGLEEKRRAYEAIRGREIPESVPPALSFQPSLPADEASGEQQPVQWTRHPGLERPDDLEEVAFWPLSRLSELVREGSVSSVELTRMYLERLRRHGPALECVVTLTAERALQEAQRADRELADGIYRGPLHGIPWGAKDLLSARGAPTTWGAQPFAGRMIDRDAAVVRRLEEAGAVLVAKLSLGALAMGDVWFGGSTRNPWNPEEGSSGSSAGPAAATVAGLVGFSIGSETLGSIVSPSHRCGATGLRPTFGRISRAGSMQLAWSMDKLGPICRSVEGCALVLDAVHGADDDDPTARTVPFDWNGDRSLSGIRVGFYRDGFQDEDATDLDHRALDVLREMGVDPVPVDLPDDLPVDALRIILSAEAAAAFDDLTRSGQDDLLVQQERDSWPNLFREARFIPAVEYIQANRIRTMLMDAVAEALENVDVVVTPSFGGDQLLTTNLTGHPAVVVPGGFQADGTPAGITFVGRLWREGELLAVAKAYQDETGFHERRPPAFG